MFVELQKHMRYRRQVSGTCHPRLCLQQEPPRDRSEHMVGTLRSCLSDVLPLEDPLAQRCLCVPTRGHNMADAMECMLRRWAVAGESCRTTEESGEVRQLAAV